MEIGHEVDILYRMATFLFGVFYVSLLRGHFLTTPSELWPIIYLVYSYNCNLVYVLCFSAQSDIGFAKIYST